MKKLIPALALISGFYINTQAQVTEAPVQSSVQIKPDIINPEGCVLTQSNVGQSINDQFFSLIFNLGALQSTEDMKAYFGEEVSGEALVTFNNNALLSQALSKEESDQPLRLEAILLINGQNIPAMFEVTRKKNAEKQVYSELTFSVPYQAMMLSRPGEIRMVLNIRS